MNERKREVVLIAGALQGLGGEFARLAAHDGLGIVLVGESEDQLVQIRADIESTYEVPVWTFHESLLSPGLGELVFEECLFYQLMHSRFAFPERIISVSSFDHCREAWDIPDEDYLLEPEMHAPAMIDLNRQFLQVLSRRGHGEILSVLARPARLVEASREMYEHTLELLLQVNHAFAQEARAHNVRVHTLCYSGDSFLLQTDTPPASLAHDMLPQTVSARELADFGYQMLNDRQRLRPAAGS
ncbi:MAG: hypothetical protein OHK0039_03690 [Bacteroidia bacterium]